jgi:hypothetical protein
MDHAKQQAEAQSNHISALMAALGMDWDRLEELRDERNDLISATQDPESDDEQAEAETALRDWDAEFLEELEEEMVFGNYGRKTPPPTEDYLKQVSQALEQSLQSEKAIFEPQNNYSCDSPPYRPSSPAASPLYKPLSGASSPPYRPSSPAASPPYKPLSGASSPPYRPSSPAPSSPVKVLTSTPPGEPFIEDGEL